MVQEMPPSLAQISGRVVPNPITLLCSEANQQLDASVAEACRIILPQASKCSPLAVLWHRAYSWQPKCLGDRPNAWIGEKRSNSSQLNTNRGKKNQIGVQRLQLPPRCPGLGRRAACLARGSTSPPLKHGFCSQLPPGQQRHYLSPAGEEGDRAHHLLRDPGAGFLLH